MKLSQESTHSIWDWMRSRVGLKASSHPRIELRLV